MGYLNISDTRNEIHHIIKGLKKDREYAIVNISEIRKNKKFKLFHLDLRRG